MIKKINDFIFKKTETQAYKDEKEKIILNALSMYCHYCNKGFKSKAGKAAHMALKHK